MFAPLIPRRWLPNALTMSRLPLSTAFYVLTIRERFIEALAVLILAQTTDWTDGALARRWHVQTRVGVILEHIADSFMLVMAGLALVRVGVLPVWLYMASLTYTALSWVTPQRIKRLWLLNVVLGMRTLLYGTALVIIPFLLLGMITESRPLLGLAIFAGLIVYGLGTIYWKRGRIHYYWRRFVRGIHSAVTH